MTTDKELKKKLRALRKLKRETQKFSPERRQINAQIREIKTGLVTREVELTGDEEKQQLVKELTDLYERKRRPIYVDFRVYTNEQLKVHLNRVKGNLV